MKKSAAAALAALIALTGAAAAGEGQRSAPKQGMASWYECCKRTANGERFKPDGMTAAHRTLPFGTMLLVEDVRTGKSVRVRVNDRGPYSHGRVIDLSRGAARQLGIISRGAAKIRMTVLNGKGSEKSERVAAVPLPTERPNDSLYAAND